MFDLVRDKKCKNLVKIERKNYPRFPQDQLSSTIYLSIYMFRKRPVKNSEPLILQVLKNKKVERMPVWFMRQAGRYLPEYRELRTKAESFIDFCLTPELAARATIQPVERFGVDAAILFADILLVPFAMDQKVVFHEGEGPVLEALSEEKQLGLLKWDIEKLDPVFETIERVYKEIDDDTALIGFSGGLWTVACYMMQGRSQPSFPKALARAQFDPEFMKYLIEDLHHATLEYLARQVEAGVDVLQIFDSHAGLLEGQAFSDFVVKPTKRLVSALKAEYPDVPIIGFPRGAKPEDIEIYASQTGVDCVGLDHTVPLDFAKDRLRGIKPLQGNLDPELLLDGGQAMLDQAQEIYRKLGPNHIFNLGHGVIKQTPPDHVAELVRFVKNMKG
jgi:uroporphyrinogen decarboxylase